MDSTININTNGDISHSNSSILDLSQRTTTIDTNNSNTIIEDWTNNSLCIYTDSIDNDIIQTVENKTNFNIEQSLTDQYKNIPIKEDSMSDSSNINKSKLETYDSNKKDNSPKSRITIHELQPCFNCSPLSLSDFLWSKYFSIINERSVSDEFFDHYLTSVNSAFEIDMKLEYCYDTQRDLYWLTQIQLVSHSLVLLHYVGIPEDDTSKDFWAYIYGQRCHPIGWCKENSKLMLPPPIVTQRAVQPTANNNTILNGSDKQITIDQGENEELQTPAAYLFDRNIGLNPVEQIKCGMLLEIQDINCPWTLWFVRVINNRGGRLHLRYVTSINEEDSDKVSSDIHIFYLDWRVHSIGWTSNNSSIYFYHIPTCFKLSSIDKQKVINMCLTESKTQFIPSNLFKDQEEIRKHRFTEGMKLEVYDSKTQNIYVGKVGQIHNEYYFDIVIDDENQYSFVSHATHPYILPAHWAAEHRFALMKGKGIRQSEDFWNLYTEKNHVDDLASERLFNLITLNSNGNNRVEPGMKMEMIYTLNNNDYVFSVTLIHVVDHLMWLRIDNTSLFNGHDDDYLFYHVLPINSLDVFPVGWAKFNGFNLLTPIEYKVKINTYEQNRYDLFSSVTHYPKIPRIYLNEIYQLTLYINIRCFSGPHFCSSRLSRIPSQFGPGPYRNVLIDLFHHLLSASSTSTNTLRVLRRLEHSSNSESSSNFKTEYIKAAKKSSKLIRPISLPTNPYLIYQYIRHICTQLETCPNLISMKQIDSNCPDKCYILINTFALSIHSKHKRTQLRAGQNRQRKQKSLLCHLKPNPIIPTVPIVPTNVLVNESSSIDQSKEILSNDISSVITPIPGSDRKTRGFRLHIEPRTHTVTRTNKKQKLTSTVTIKQEPVDNNNIKIELSPSITIPIKELKRTRLGKNKRSPSPSVTMNILSNSCSSSNKNKKNRRSPEMIIDSVSSCSNITIPKVEIQQSTFAISPIDTRNPVTWNVNDVCSYLNQSGCSFALKTIKEQEIDGAALLLLDDLPKVQDLLEFKLGPAVKFCHVVEKLRTQVIDTFHSSPSLKTSCLSATNTS
ncbi:unnamed protein product [Rotaria magnacalcarata]|uniref:SAM domain-containing protein n=1 Tax=Rotaria magnacalcarata TaxID=392030 RepID=A0A816MTU0_9BILA|nr:unnamed protein product [Rotaria magnacalcarata]CAF4187043.1 unnamed protein product [Rotaria magnacalcarata]